MSSALTVSFQPAPAGIEHTCSICLVTATSGLVAHKDPKGLLDRFKNIFKKATTEPLFHFYHERCLKTWKTTSETCPECRRSIARNHVPPPPVVLDKDFWDSIPLWLQDS